jgi:hypothetical protein
MFIEHKYGNKHKHKIGVGTFQIKADSECAQCVCVYVA